MTKRIRSYFYRFSVIPGAGWLWLAATMLVAGGVACSSDEQSHVHVADTGAAAGGLESIREEATVDPDDPHAHHRSMMENQGFSRSEHCYDVPNPEVVNADGERVHLLEVLDNGQPVMLNFIFTTCTTICPVQSASFRQVQQQLGEESNRVRMVSVSIDPEYDTPDQLHEYARRFEAGPQWQFLTGKLADIIAIQKAFDSYRGNKMSHEPVTLLRASPESSWVRLDGLVGAGDIVQEYRSLTTEH